MRLSRQSCPFLQCDISVCAGVTFSLASPSDSWCLRLLAPYSRWMRQHWGLLRAPTPAYPSLRPQSPVHPHLRGYLFSGSLPGQFPPPPQPQAAAVRRRLPADSPAASAISGYGPPVLHCRCWRPPSPKSPTLPGCRPLCHCFLPPPTDGGASPQPLLATTAACRLRLHCRDPVLLRTVVAFDGLGACCVGTFYRVGQESSGCSDEGGGIGAADYDFSHVVLDSLFVDPLSIPSFPSFSTHHNHDP